MTVSVFDLFQIGVGPSSSHTVGPMRAGLAFAQAFKKALGSGLVASDKERGGDLEPLEEGEKLAGVVTPQEGDGPSITVILYGSLAATGLGHGTLDATLLGLDGANPGQIDPDYMEQRIGEIRRDRTVRVAGDEKLLATCGFEDIILRPAVRRTIHTNAVTFVGSLGVDAEGQPRGSVKQTYYSIGGGFIRTEDEVPKLDELTGEYLFDSGEKLLELCERGAGDGAGVGAGDGAGAGAGDDAGAGDGADGLGDSEAAAAGESDAVGAGESDAVGSRASELLVSEVQRECERSLRTDEEIDVALDAIAQAMEDCAKRGMSSDGLLPGMLQVRRRAKRWYDQLMDEDPHKRAELSEDWVNLVALAVNEENAAGGRVVTAPTNGAAGIIPAVMFYARTYTKAGKTDPRDVNRRFLLAAGAIGSLYKERASISGAEVGCQGEVGSAASMAAAGLAEILGGTPRQVANAAEIAMEHSLGLTCDPIGGLVQIPCIERNAISAGKAINAAKMALRGDGEHHVTLDEVIETMRQTGADMNDKYKETAGGGLATNVAVNVPEC